MRLLGVFLAVLAVASAGQAQTLKLKPGLEGLGFLLGRWSTLSSGKVLDTGGGSKGRLDFTAEAGGSVVLRKDHVQLFDAAGAHTGDFDIIMMIYAEGASVRADYADGDHIIHYVASTIDPGRSATFLSAASSTAPTFKLVYALGRSSMLDIAFLAAPPGTSDFHPIATGSVAKER